MVTTTAQNNTYHQGGIRLQATLNPYNPVQLGQNKEESYFWSWEFPITYCLKTE